ncbi:MAG: GNAT family N-acetyltransferase, partial [bacterium]|nr:GNAT family N-acetyltransferase [bacterium]
VRDSWQNRGIGSFLLRHLTRIARRNGIAGFVAEVLGENRSMQAVLHKSGLKVESHLVDGTVSFLLDFEN